MISVVIAAAKFTMVHIRRAATLGWLLALLGATPALATQAPIRTEAQLTRYLHSTSSSPSPLDALSPGGRKRFLAGLEFAERGLISMGLDDPANELTHPQIVEIFTLFGAQALAPEGISPAEQARRMRERQHDAATRGCAPERCAPSEVEQRYDELVLHADAGSISDAERSASAGERYDRLFSPYQTAGQVRRASAVDLRLLRRAAEYIVPKTASPARVGHLRLDLAEMQRRGMVTDKDYIRLHQALITMRDFAAAEALATQHKDMGIEAVPRYRPSAQRTPGLPTALSVDARNGTMSRQSIDLSGPLRIVVVASCHISRKAAQAIAADEQLRPLFVRDATWLADQTESFAAVSDWNREFPGQPIHVAWSNNEWSMLNRWTMPTFYVFRDGKLVQQFSGWFDIPTLRQSLREAGALP